MRRGSGSGKVLMKFGTDMADKIGLPCFLEGSLEDPWLVSREWIRGGRLDLAKYQPDGEHAKEGDERLERVEGLGEGWYSHTVMVRPAASPFSKGMSVDSRNKVKVGI